jgi:hypothetical protein
MMPHPHAVVSMQGVARKHVCHTTSDKAKPSEPKKQCKTQPVLWCPVNCHIHIKNKTPFNKEKQAPDRSVGVITGFWL